MLALRMLQWVVRTHHVDPRPAIAVAASAVVTTGNDHRGDNDNAQ